VTEAASHANYGTISEMDRHKASYQRSTGLGQDALPPRLRQKKSRPFSAPRRQGLKSVGLKNKVANTNSHTNLMRPSTGVAQGHEQIGTVEEEEQVYYQQEEEDEQEIVDINTD